MGDGGGCGNHSATLGWDKLIQILENVWKYYRMVGSPCSRISSFAAMYNNHAPNSLY